MVKKLLIWVLPLLAMIGGVAGGDALAPRVEEEAATGPEGETEGGAEGEAHAADGAATAEAAGATEPEATAKDKAEHDAAEDGAEAHGAAESAEGEAGGGHGEGAAAEGAEGAGSLAWFSFPNQFFIPLVRRGAIEAMMVLTLTIETSTAELDGIEDQEHRLRDALLRSLIIHANTGGFADNYTAEAKMDRLRQSLQAAAVEAAGSAVHAVLIEDIGLSGR